MVGEDDLEAAGVLESEGDLVGELGGDEEAEMEGVRLSDIRADGEIVLEREEEAPAEGEELDEADRDGEPIKEVEGSR